MINIQQGTKEWHEFRSNGIGSSEIAAIMGKSPFKKPIDVYNEKMGLTTPFISQAMKRGSFYEPEARKAFEGDSHISFAPVCWIHPDCSYIRASLDGYNLSTNAILEIKVPTEENFESLCKKIPTHYMIQIQWQMMTCGATTGVFLVYSPELEEFRATVIYPDEKLYAEMKEAAKVFWENFLRGIPPETNEEESIYVQDDKLEALSEELLMFREMKKTGEKGEELVKPKLYDFGDDGNFHGKLLRFKKNFKKGAIDYESLFSDLGIAEETVEKYRKPGMWYYTIIQNKDDD